MIKVVGIMLLHKPWWIITKKIIDLFVGLFGSVNDSQVFQKSSFYKKAMYQCCILIEVAKMDYHLTS
jgi:hypothetical protein